MTSLTSAVVKLPIVVLGKLKADDDVEVMLPSTSGTLALTEDLNAAVNGMVTENGAQTLTNKTLDSPVIASLKQSESGGIINMPEVASDASDTLAVKSDTDTLLLHLGLLESDMNMDVYLDKKYYIDTRAQDYNQTESLASVFKDKHMDSNNYPNGAIVTGDTFTTKDVRYVIWNWRNPPSFNLVTSASGMFQNCYSLSSLTFPTSVTFGSLTNASYMFSDCQSLSSVTFPSSVTFGSLTNASYMFQNCYSLSSLTFGSSVTFGSLTDANHIFAYCRSLSSVTFPSSVTFGSLSNLTSMFQNCLSLSSITFPSSVTFGSLNSASHMFAYCSSLPSITFPSSVTFGSLTDAGYMFAWCYSLSSITFPSSVTFESLKNSSLSNKVYNMFTDCRSLSSIIMSGKAATNLKAIRDSNSNMSLSFAITPTDNGNTLNEYIVNNLSIVAEKINVGEGEHTGTTSYTDSSSGTISDITVPANAIDTANKLTYIKYSFANNVTYSGSTFTSFKGIKPLQIIDLSNVTFSASELSMASAFEDCWSLRQVKWHANTTFDNVTSLARMFFNAYSLEEHLIANNTELASVLDATQMFSRCFRLEDIYFPSSVTFAALANATSMFEECRSLRAISFPTALSFGSLTNATTMFKNCTALKTIKFSVDTDFAALTNVTNMFQTCTSLATIIMTQKAAAKLKQLTVAASNTLEWDDSIILDDSESTTLRTFICHYDGDNGHPQVIDMI